MQQSNVILFEKNESHRETRVNMRLLLAEWSFHIFSSSLCFFMMGATALLAICVITDFTIKSEFTIQILKAIFDNPVAFAIVWAIAFLLILGAVAVRTIEVQKKNYREFCSASRRRK